MNEQTNPQLELARRYVEETGQHVFLTGKAGTGKTTFLRRLKAAARKRMIVAAPTGVAAVNAGGVTLHSFFQLPFSPYIPSAAPALRSGRQPWAQRLSREKVRIVRSLDLLVIDEVSMVRADLLDQVDSVLRLYRHSDEPFGGVQLLLIGDLQQLAPVAKDDERKLLQEAGGYETLYFFGSHALQKTHYVTIELQTVYRQTDARFLDLLNRIRQGGVPDEAALAALNERYCPGFRPEEARGYIMLTTHNWQAQAVNERCLDRLPGKAWEYEPEVEGDFPEALYPVAPSLRLKEGAQVMFLKNDTEVPRRFYNGKIGRVHCLSAGRIEVMCDDWASPVAVEPAVWENTQYRLNEASREIEETVVGTFRHYPLRLAWAITIHKSQGLTFDRVIIDAGQSFAHGQVYVALSRCRSLQGLVLSRPLVAGNLIDDSEIAAFTRRVEEEPPSAESLEEDRRLFRLKLLDELFDFRPMQAALGRLGRLLDEYMYRTYPQLLARWKEMLALLPGQVLDVSQKFARQYRPLALEPETDVAASRRLQERVAAAAVYFGRQVEALRPVMLAAEAVESDNKTVKKRWSEALAEARLLVGCKQRLMGYAATGFEVQGYLAERALAFLPDEPKSAKTARRKRGEAKAEVPSDLLHPELFDALRRWRSSRATDLGLPAYMVLQQKALMGIANLQPSTLQELLRVPYVGKKIVEQYGEELLALVVEYRGQGGE
ncbi:MAG: AAA family ATPase [Bacteroidaceae bacterium]|jgi:hypothetical protein